MTEIYIRSYDKRVSKKGNAYYDGSCRVKDNSAIKWFICFDQNLVDAVGPEGGTITANLEPTLRDDKVLVSDVRLSGVNGYVQEAKRLDSEAGLEKKIAELETRIKTLEMVVADIELGKPMRRGAAQATQNGLV